MPNPTTNTDPELPRRLKAALAAGEITTPTARELAELSLRVCELELERAALLGKLDAANARLARRVPDYQRRISAALGSSVRRVSSAAPQGRPTRKGAR